MAAPPENKESNTFSVTIDDWDSIQDEFLSPVYRINGYPWRLHMVRYFDRSVRQLFLICDKYEEAALWKCTATVTMTVTGMFKAYTTNHEHTFHSWDAAIVNRIMFLRTCYCSPFVGSKIQIEITTKEDGNSWKLYPVPEFGIYDCILVCGEKKEKVHVNKKSLASQSPFFDRLFFGDFKEKNMKEIPIGDVEGEELFNIINLLYHFDGAYLSDHNVHSVLQLADRFELKIGEDRAVSYLLSSSSSLSIVDILLIADTYNILFLKDNLHMKYEKADIIDLCYSTEFDQVPHDLLRVLFNKGNIDAFADDTSDIFWNSLFSNKPLIKEWSVMSMVVNDSHRQQFSPVFHINGFPWRLRIKGSYSGYEAYLICDKSNEAELWKCTATISATLGESNEIYDLFLDGEGSFTFTSWDKKSHTQCICSDLEDWGGYLLTVEIATDVDGESYCRRPSLDPLEPRDGILVFENMEKTVEVNKNSLASQSPFFDRLFFGNFKEDMKEIPIRDVGYEEFANLMAVLYESNEDSSLNCNNIERMLQLANRFELKFVEDRVSSFLLSSASSSVSLVKKLLIADLYNLAFLKDELFSQFESIDQLKELSESPEWNKLSKETIRILFKMFCI